MSNIAKKNATNFEQKHWKFNNTWIHVFFVATNFLRFGGWFDPGFDRVGTSLAWVSQNQKKKSSLNVFFALLVFGLSEPRANTNHLGVFTQNRTNWFLPFLRSSGDVAAWLFVEPWTETANATNHSGGSPTSTWKTLKGTMCICYCFDCCECNSKT